MKDFMYVIKSMFSKPKIYFVSFWVGQKCSLKCRLCCNLIPYMKQNSYDTEELIKDLHFLVQNSRIEFLQIQGGEPFTHPDICKIIDAVRAYTQHKLFMLLCVGGGCNTSY